MTTRTRTWSTAKSIASTLIGMLVDDGKLALDYLQNGLWNGERLISEAWIDFVRSPAPATAERGHFYGGQFWLVPDERTDIPKDAYSTAGNRGQYVVIVPSHDLVIVRRGLDWGRQGFDRWEMTREVVKAFPGAAVAEAAAAGLNRSQSRCTAPPATGRAAAGPGRCRIHPGS